MGIKLYENLVMLMTWALILLKILVHIYEPNSCVLFCPTHLFLRPFQAESSATLGAIIIWLE